MAKTRSTSRIYWKRGRAYADFRDFADVGGGREALRLPEERFATTDPDLAAALAADRLKELKAAREKKRTAAEARAFGLPSDEAAGATLATFAADHLDRKAQDGEAVKAWLAQSQRHLEAAVEYFGPDTALEAITPPLLDGYVDHLRGRGNGRGGTLSDTSVRKYLNSLSNLYRRAVSLQLVASNPVAAMYAKPTEGRVEAQYLSAEEAALLLESARTYRPSSGDVRQEHGGSISAKPTLHLYPILATFLLTGARKSEVLGLEVDDVSLQLGKIYIRPNRWRRVKTEGSRRSIPLWPQLEEILRAYLLEREREGGMGSLLFPSARGAEEAMIRNLRRALDVIAVRAGFPAGHVRLHMLRHTYTAARIQTLDRGAPVALYTVARELGHRSTTMIEKRYGHLHDRAILGGSEVVEFRANAFQAKPGTRLDSLREDL